MGSDWRSPPQISCGPFWGNRGSPDYTSLRCLLPFSQLDSVLTASFCSPAPTRCGPCVHIGPCTGPALFPSLTCSVSVSAPPVLFWSELLFLSVPISTSVSSFAPPPRALSRLLRRVACAQPVPQALLTSGSSVSKLFLEWLSPKERPVETREGCPAVLLPSAQ